MKKSDAIVKISDLLLDRLSRPTNGDPIINILDRPRANLIVGLAFAGVLEEACNVKAIYAAENERLRRKCNRLIQAGRIALVPVAMHAVEEPTECAK